MNLYPTKSDPYESKSLNQTEPAYIRGIVMALIGLGGVIGLKLNQDDIDVIVNAALVLVPLAFVFQAWWTRRNVYAPATVKEEVSDAKAVGYSKGLTDAGTNVAVGTPKLVDGAVLASQIAGNAWSYKKEDTVYEPDSDAPGLGPK